MHLSSITLCGLFIASLQLSDTYPISTSLTETDMDALKVLLQRIQASFPEPVADKAVPAESDSVEDLSLEAAADGHQTQGLDIGRAREFLSAKNLKAVRNDTSRKLSSCFGRRMDRIGSMSSLGCNSVGRYNPK